MHQKTLRTSCHIKGVGLHTGEETAITLMPAPVNTGVVFFVMEGGRRIEIPARQEFVVRTTLSTTLGRDGVEIWTVEHLMAALAGLEIDNCYVLVEGREIPAGDGSAQPFVSRIMESGRQIQSAPRRFIKILAPIVVEEGDKVAGYYPAVSPTLSFLIDFDHQAIQTQSHKIHLNAQTFVSQLAKARTFGFVEDLEKLKAQGYARGAELSNAVGLGKDGQVLNPDGLRYQDEFVRHKLLDAVGDLSLAGLPVLGEYRGIKSGHQFNLKLIQALAEEPGKWEIVTSELEEETRAAV